MPILKPKTTSEAADLISNITYAGLGLLAGISAANVAGAFLSEGYEPVLETAKLIMALILVLISAPYVFYLKRKFGKLTTNPWRSESFLSSSMKKAAWTTFIVMAVFLVFMTTMDNLILSRLSSKTVMDAAMMLLFGTMSVSFFIVSRTPDDDGDFV